MRPQVDGLRAEAECPSLDSSISSFSPLDPPTPATSSVYGQGSVASPSLPDGGSYPPHIYEGQTVPSPLKSSLHLAEIASQDDLPLSYSMDATEQRLPLSEGFPGYNDGSEQFWFLSEIPKSCDNPGAFPCPAMNQHASMARRNPRPQHAPCPPESATNPCLSRPMFGQPEHMPNSSSTDNVLHWILSVPSMGGFQAFPAAPMTPPPPSYSEFPTLVASFDSSQTPATSVSSCSFSTPSEPTTPINRLSGASADGTEEFPISLANRGLPHQLQRQPSRRGTGRSSSKRNLTLDNLPSIIKQVQFKCEVPGCRGRFKRQEHLKRHIKSHSREKPHVCWVPGCQRAFSRSDNLNAHYTKTHSKRGGRNRYVASLDVNSPDYDPEFRGQLTSDGRPIYGSKPEEPVECEFSVDL